MDPFAAQNFGFELVDGVAARGWVVKNGEAPTVTDEKHGGARALRLEGERYASTRMPAKDFIGKRLTLHGFIKSRDAAFAALWIRADSAGEMLAIDNMEPTRINGTQPWTAVAVSIDVPAGADTLIFGAMQVGNGVAWFDDLRVEIGEITPPAEIELQGVVVDPAGATVPGAVVALISGEAAIVQHVTTNAQGRFAIKTREGKWGVSAHRAPAVGAFLPLAPYAKTTELRLALGKDGVTVRGKAQPETFLRISPVSELDADLFVVPVGADGTFSAVLPASTEYYVAVLDGFAAGSFKRAGTADHVDVVLETLPLVPPPADVVAYIARHAIPLASAEPGHGFDDLTPVGKLVGKARIVALGEATHGSREIFQMKHRILEYLVAKQGFTVFAIEANQPECRAINEYVLHGKGTAKDALAGIYFWTWNTEEVLAMIEWMRAWNAEHPTKVQFTGFDMQTSKVAYANVEAAVVQAVPAKAEELMAPLAPLSSSAASEAVAKLGEPARAALVAALAALRPVLAKADADTRHDLRILEQAAAMYMQKRPYEARDAAMAENVGWLLEQTKARIVVWAHNGHIANELSSYTNLGSHLRTKYKRAYLNLGFVFGEGAFQAIDMTKQPPRLGEVTLGPAPAYLASAAFAKTGKPLIVLDLRALPKRGPVATWFAAKHLVRDTGATFLGERQMTYPVVLPALYDGVIYIDKTTRARPVRK